MRGSPPASRPNSEAAQFRVYGAAVITALTAQNTKGVFGIHDVPADFVAAQLNAVFTDLAPGAVKVGMLANIASIDIVTAALDRYRPPNVVVDPVMVASSGETLLRANALGRLRELFARVRVITPNLPEAAALLETAPTRDENEMRAQAEKLLAFGAGAVLIKGGHGAVGSFARASRSGFGRRQRLHLSWRQRRRCRRLRAGGFHRRADDDCARRHYRRRPQPRDFRDGIGGGVSYSVCGTLLLAPRRRSHQKKRSAV
jgi:hypothetical protein